MEGSSKLKLALYALDAALAATLAYKLMEMRWMYKYKKQKELESRKNEPKKKPVIVWVDGVFDMMHFGHANMLRQAKALGDILIVGVNSDASVRTQKGTAPVMTEEERYIAVESCRWVDQIVKASPYVMDNDYLKYITDTYGIDIIVHGDDECLDAQGNDVYGQVKKEGRFRTVKRTEGVSSTDIVGRMLLMTRDHHNSDSLGKLDYSSDNDSDPTVERLAAKQAKVSRFLPTTRRLSQFSAGKAPKPGDRIVYIDGSFDMFHAGHIQTLKAAKPLGDFLLVGICDDATVNKKRGGNWPIMNLHERTLCVLSCRYVDEVIIGAPWQITKDLITTMNISLVLHGTTNESAPYDDGMDPYEVAKELGLYKQIQSPSNLTAYQIVDRILAQRKEFKRRFETKAKKEEEYHEKKTFVAEI